MENDETRAAVKGGPSNIPAHSSARKTSRIDIVKASLVRQLKEQEAIEEMEEAEKQHQEAQSAVDDAIEQCTEKVSSSVDELERVMECFVKQQVKRRRSK